MRLAAVALVAVLAGCSGEKPAETTGTPSPSLAYPMTTCVVSGEPLGGMGPPVNITHEGLEVRFCCQKCVAEFNKDPKKYMAIIEAARKK
jgi:hypothetical protein